MADAEVAALLQSVEKAVQREASAKREAKGRQADKKAGKHRKGKAGSAAAPKRNGKVGERGKQDKSALRGEKGGHSGSDKGNGTTRTTGFDEALVKTLGGSKAEFRALVSLDDEDELTEVADGASELDEGALRSDVKDLWAKLQADPAALDASVGDEDEDDQTDDDAEVEDAAEQQQASLAQAKLPDKYRDTLDSGLIVLHHSPWFDNYVDDQDTRRRPIDAVPMSYGMVDKIRERGVELQKRQAELFEQYQEQRKGMRHNARWLHKVKQEGTLQDRLAAQTLSVQESPVHNLAALQQLLSVSGKKARREAFMAIVHLTDLFRMNLLPARHLISLADRPISNATSLSDRLLLLWSFEDSLKQAYAQLISNLEVILYDPLPYYRNKALSTLYELMLARPEQEQRMLSLIVNKFGDQDRKLASKVRYLLHMLLKEHSAMKEVVFNEVESLIYRPRVAQRTQYYCVTFLNQILLSHNESDLAARLIACYFGLFNQLVKQDQLASRMNSALLSGVNRAFPYAPGTDTQINAHIDSLFRIVHQSPFPTATQALMLLFQVMQSHLAVSDRFYTALYDKLMSPDLMTVTKPTMFLNLLFRALKADVIPGRVLAFTKRMLQRVPVCQPPLMCGFLLIVSELAKQLPHLRLLLTQSNAQASAGADSDEEHFVDQPDDDADAGPHDADDAVGDASDKGTTQAPSQHTGARSQAYDAGKRNPAYAHADRSCVWELVPLCAHWHPSVAVFAETLLAGQAIDYQGDPLVDFSSAAFLDKFVTKKPKKIATDTSRKSQAELVLGRRRQVSKRATSLVQQPMALLQRDRRYVRPDERFFYDYYDQLNKDGKLKSHTQKKKEDAERRAGMTSEEVADAEFDELLMQGAAPDGTDVLPPDMSDEDPDFSDISDISDGGVESDGDGDGDDPDAALRAGDDSDGADDAGEFFDEIGSDEDDEDDDDDQAGFGDVDDDEDDDAVGAGDGGESRTSRKKRKRTAFQAQLDNLGIQLDGDAFASADQFSAMLENDAAAMQGNEDDDSDGGDGSGSDGDGDLDLAFGGGVPARKMARTSRGRGVISRGGGGRGGRGRGRGGGRGGRGGRGRGGGRGGRGRRF